MEEERQNLPAVILQTPEKVLGGSGLGSFPVGSQGWASCFLPSPIEEVVEESQSGGVQGLGGAEGCVFREGLALQQERADRRSPGMMVVLFNGGQFPQKMGVAEGVLSRVAEIGTPEVVDHGSLGPVHHAQGLDSLLAPFGVKPVEGDPAGGGHMGPMESPVDPESRLVGMRKRRPNQEMGHMVPEGGEVSGKRPAGFQRGGFARHGAKEVGAELPDPIERERLLLVKVGQGGLEPEAILGRSGDSFRGGRRDRLPAPGTGRLVQSVFRDFQAGFGQVEDLARLVGVGDRVGQVLPAGTEPHRQIDHVVR